jgi:hypothetical protein
LKSSWFAWNALFPKEILPFISSSIELFPFTIDPRYLNDLTCSRWVWMMSVPSVLWCFFVHLRYFVLCSFMFSPTCADISFLTPSLQMRNHHKVYQKTIAIATCDNGTHIN